jgi:hypothetical protein
MKAALTADKLAKVWQAMTQQFGARGAREPAQVSEASAHVVVVTPLHYGKSVIDAQVACDADGKIGGFYIKPHQ